MKILLSLILIWLFLSISAFAQVKSVYTSLAAKDCKTIESNDQEGGSYRGECPGAGGYRLELLEGDIRQTINIIAPDKTRFELDLWSKVSSGFSAVGEKAEWRVRSGRPSALIIRFNVNEKADAEDPAALVSYLVIAKITGNSACLTDVVGPVKNQNVKARQLADQSAGKPCYKTR